MSVDSLLLQGLRLNRKIEHSGETEVLITEPGHVSKQVQPLLVSLF